MLKSKKGYLTSEILDYEVRDSHSKKIGIIRDLLINARSHKIEYIIIGRKKWAIPVSFLNMSSLRLFSSLGICEIGDVFLA